jgi:hypothetical protein
MKADLVITRVEKARLLLAEAKTIQQAQQILSMADAARTYARRIAASTETINHATEIKIRAERLMGEMLAKIPKNPGTRTTGGSGGSCKAPPAIPTLKTVGVSRKQSARAQKLASVPLFAFEQSIEEQKGSGREISAAAILRRQLADGAANIVAPRRDGDTKETFWSRGLLTRAEIAQGGALFEDWSDFQVGKKHVAAAQRAARAWRKVADYLEELYETQKAKTRAA